MDDLPVVNTVRGQVPAEDLGITLTHEHLAMNPGDPALYGDSIFDDTDKIIEEAGRFALAGGGTIVEMTPLNFGRNVSAYREISEAVGIHVICATGFHKQEFIPEWVYTSTDEEISAYLIAEITQGISGSNVKPGVIKVGTSRGRITEIEQRVIRLVSQVQQETGLPVGTHTDKGTMALEQCQMFLQSGARPQKVIIGHVDIPKDVNLLKQICALGFNVQIDHVGRDLADRDRVRIGMIKELIASGFLSQVFISGDMGKRTYLKVYGGEPGLDYILDDFKAFLFEQGVTAAEYEHMLIHNPRRVFGRTPA